MSSKAQHAWKQIQKQGCLEDASAYRIVTAKQGQDCIWNLHSREGKVGIVWDML
jgi:hypothetical protein